MASTYHEPNRPQNNRDFGTYGESFPPYNTVTVIILTVIDSTLVSPTASAAVNSLTVTVRYSVTI